MTTRPEWEPSAEPWLATARRTGLLALAIGIGAGLYARRLTVVPVAALVALWFTLGGHFVELLFRNRLRRHVSARPQAQVLARLAYWFLGGSLLYTGALTTWMALTGGFAARWPWWLGGAGFVAAELVIHLLIQARRQPSFYNGRG